MFVTIKYSDLNDLDEVITFDFVHYPNIKIINRSDDSILVEYPDDWSVEDVINMFERHEKLFLFYDFYILTIANELGFEYLKQQISSNGLTYKILSSNSLIINALHVHYNQLKEIINNNMFSFLLRPYQDTNYIKLPIDLSKFYKLGLLSDVEIHVQDHVFKAHKIVLAANSQHFFNTFVTYGPETGIVEINDDVDLIKDLLDLLYGLEVKIEGVKNGIRTLQLIQIILYFLIPNIDIESIIKKVKIIPEFESNEYISLIAKIYPEHVPDELIPYLKENITSRTDISNLPLSAQDALLNQMNILI